MWKIAHISDLHISKISLSLSQFFSKRWIGNVNLLLLRKKIFKIQQLLLLSEIFKKENIDYIIVSGDITCTSFKKEFEIAQQLFQEMEKTSKIFFIPGNHDHYTKTAHKNKTFYKYFENKKGKNEIEKIFCLKKDKIEAHLLKNRWWYVGLDTALATHLLSSRGLFSEILEKNLISLLKRIPSDENIILVNHFPLIASEGTLKSLKRAKKLEAIIKKHTNIKLFLHGHTHKHKITDLRKKNLPIILDSGSTAHNNLGKWNLLEFNENRVNISIYDWEKKTNKWKKSISEIFML
ncbi:MAG: hypothetical protein AMS24_02460 [Chlamydiae bacterium SM23_39]|nr:MAG: hypothetical protein AMS24_02460 [Chlamydiae bacterium SM23_39]